jgi:ribonuclease P protein component
MLPKRHRLTQSRDFTRVRRFGRSCGSPLSGLYVLSNGSTELRIGFSVSKRVGKATVRNSVKRRMREAVRHRLPDIRPGQDLVFTARPRSADASYHQIAESVAYLLRKSGAAYPSAESVRNG